MDWTNSLMTLMLSLPVAEPGAEVREACVPCEDVDAWTSLFPSNKASIPIDGVLLIHGSHTGEPAPEDFLTLVQLEVTRDGQPIAGAIESAGDHALAWRPAEPLAPSATYKVTGSLDNPDLGEYEDYCAPDIVVLDAEFFTDVGPSAPLKPPKIGTTEQVFQSEVFEALEELVCCDDALPLLLDECPDYDYDFIFWGGGYCASTHGRGRLHVAVEVDTGLPASTDAMVTRRLIVDGEPGRLSFGAVPSVSASGTQPFCTVLELRNVATGEVLMSEETCHGADVADQLGELEFDPTPNLDKHCMGQPYVCEIDPMGPKWNGDACTPWPGDGPTSDGPTSDGPTSDGPTSDGPTSDGPTSDGPTGGGPGTDGTGPDATGSASQGEDTGSGDKGCACDGRAADPLGVLGLIGLGLLRRRRRFRT